MHLLNIRPKKYLIFLKFNVQHRTPNPFIDALLDRRIGDPVICFPQNLTVLFLVVTLFNSFPVAPDQTVLVGYISRIGQKGI